MLQLKVPQVALVRQLVDNVAETFTFCLFCPKTRHPLLAHANPLTPLVPVWQLGLAILVGRAPNQVSSASRCFWDKFPANLLYFGAKMRESVPAGGRSCTHVDGVLQRMDAVLPGRGNRSASCARYLYTAPGRRLPTRTPSTAHFLYLPFFALLTIGGDEEGISSYRRSAATRISRNIFPIITLLDS